MPKSRGPFKLDLGTPAKVPPPSESPEPKVRVKIEQKFTLDQEVPISWFNEDWADGFDPTDPSSYPQGEEAINIWIMKAIEDIMNSFGYTYPENAVDFFMAEFGIREKPLDPDVTVDESLQWEIVD